MGNILLIANSKGGVGKSTTAVNLAVGFALKGLRIGLADLDIQGSSIRWNDRRHGEDIRGPVRPSMMFYTRRVSDAYSGLISMAKDYDIVIGDAGGRDTQEMRAAMAAANLLLIPVTASQPDLETIPEMEDLVSAARDDAINPSLAASVLLTRVSTNPLNREAAAAREAIQSATSLPILRSVIRDRKIYRDTFAEGFGVLETGHSQAKAEMQLLIDEIWR